MFAARRSIDETPAPARTLPMATQGVDRPATRRVGC